MPIQLSSLIPSGGSVEDNREFKNWQDWVGNSNDGHSNIGQATRVVLGQTVNRRPGGSATFTVPSGVTKIRVTCIGGGGGGGNYGSTYYGGKGGGGGCFASGEYTVSPGDQLSVTVGVGGGGHKSSGGYGGNGGTSSVTDNSTGGSNIAVSAGGGSGGYYQNQGGGGASSHSVSGNSLVSGSTVGGHGGSAGEGSSYAFGFGPEGYGSGGGGAAGSFLGNGGQGGSGHNGGYTYSAGGGGGIGGSGGRGYGAEVNSASNQYQDHAGAGGGSAGNGEGSTYNNSSYRARGGNARYDATQTPDFNDGTLNARGQMPMRYDNAQELKTKSHGARHGDGENSSYELRNAGGSASNTSDETSTSYIQRGAGGSTGLGQYDQFGTASAEGESLAPQTGTKQKSFNGVLGRLWGGGGGGAPCHDDNFGYYNHSGGDGGSGAGGGGASGATTSWNSGQRNHSVYACWDWTNLAYRVKDSAWDTNAFRINGHGGNGGALGGGGGSAAYAPGGAGGIGGGGGGGGGHYSGGSYYGTGGPGGPGYVLIEW